MGDPQKHILCIKWRNISKRFLYSPRSEDKECRSVNYVLSHIQLCAALWIGGCQAPLPMEFSRQEYWSGVPFPTTGDLSNLGSEPWSPALQADSLPSEPPGRPQYWTHKHQKQYCTCSRCSLFAEWILCENIFSVNKHILQYHVQLSWKPERGGRFLGTLPSH